MVRIDKNMRGALIAVLVLNTFVCGLIAWVLFQSYRQYQDRAILVTANLSRVLDENFSSRNRSGPPAGGPNGYRSPHILSA